MLLALVTTGLRRSELCALEWRDLELDGRKRSLLVRCGKGGKPRRQPVPAGLARELRKLRDARQPEPTDPVFCGLAGGRLQETILADIIRRAATRAGIEKHVTAHTLRHTAATWLRQELGDTRLVAEYLGHADLSTVARYAHVDRDELFDAAGRLEQLAAPREEPAASAEPERPRAPRRLRRRPSDVGSAAPSPSPTSEARPSLTGRQCEAGRLVGCGRRSQGRRAALSDPNYVADSANRRNRRFGSVHSSNGAARGAAIGSRALSGEPELLARRRVSRRDDDGALEHLGAEEGLHQLVVGAVAEHLRLGADGGGVLGRVGGSLAGEPPLEDPLGGPPVDGVRGHLDLEHPVGDVLAHARARRGRPGGRRARAP